ncbi:hypothetical protein EV401DRAFT_1890065 [Pisolithus croceorrhizus]|nr:hypothetical protein EV401DRAFT_1890065 [Pisolithus croceorrhizus]
MPSPKPLSRLLSTPQPLLLFISMHQPIISLSYLYIKVLGWYQDSSKLHIYLKYNNSTTHPLIWASVKKNGEVMGIQKLRLSNQGDEEERSSQSNYHIHSGMDKLCTGARL